MCRDMKMKEAARPRECITTSSKGGHNSVQVISNEKKGSQVTPRGGAELDFAVH